MRVKIDWDLCKGHGVCQEEAPEIFEVNDAGQLTLLQELPPEGLRAKLVQAVKYCPTKSISIVEDR